MFLDERGWSEPTPLSIFDQGRGAYQTFSARSLADRGGADQAPVDAARPQRLDQQLGTRVGALDQRMESMDGILTRGEGR
ncbi:MAG: hypothetical protein VYD19_08260 [Myxococcota bacterium]|nr:hypothetical protein [Myxococcota bacterium]